MGIQSQLKVPKTVKIRRSQLKAGSSRQRREGGGGKEYTKKMKALGWWLMLVGSLRLPSVWFGFFDIWALRLAVFSNTTMSEVHGRTFGVWTLLTCTLCFLWAFNLENKPLYLVTFLSFIYAFGHFLTEYLFYNTMALSNLTTVGIFAGTSIVWMLLQWNAHQQRHVKHA
ncbi:hypothetical protein V6N11_003599 [Hibiscus sabdariffa]|uniref:Ergosterol biosynthetic protein 28 n=1 Tax=Hibiscus sabdariffa TaxID=183260 RepID=A0ABR2SEG6_9ROSI